MPIQIIIVWIVALLITFFTVPFVIQIAKRFDLVDNPKKRYHPAHTHKGIIPRAGGLAIYIGFLISVLLFLPVNPTVVGITVCATILVSIGLFDDRKDVNPYVRLFSNIFVTCIALLSGITIPYITNPISGGILDLASFSIHFSLFNTQYTIAVLSLICAFLWIMWTMNIIGWSAGIDGQMPGFVSISAFVLGILSERYSMEDPSLMWVTLFAFIVSGIFAGFLPWNFFPQKIMPGYGGKTLAGFFLAILGILSFAKVGTALLVLGIPTIDAGITLIRRLKKNQPLVSADRGHLHHILLNMGWSKPKIALFYWAVSAILGLIALSVNSKQKIFTLLLSIVIIGSILLWLNFFSHSSKQQDQDSG